MATIAEAKTKPQLSAKRFVSRECTFAPDGSTIFAEQDESGIGPTKPSIIDATGS